MSKFSNKFAILDNKSDNKDDMSNDMSNVMSFGSIERTKTNQGSRFHSVSTSSDVEIENKMENPEIKALLKSAKDAIKAKEFGEALKICKVSFLICKIRILIWKKVMKIN
jgi:hypothetical protein